MLHVYHLINSRSQRVIWLLEELGLEYEIIFCTRDQETHMAPQNLQKMHPLGKVPILIDDRITLAETSAIFDYLLEKYDHVQLVPPSGSLEKIHYLYWKNFSEGSFMPNLAMKQVFARMTAKCPWFVRPVFKRIQYEVNQRYINPTLYNELNYIESHLNHYQWFSGNEISATDILLTFLLEAASVSIIPVAHYPKITEYLNCVRNRPSYQHALERGKWSVDEHQKYWNGV